MHSGGGVVAGSLRCSFHYPNTDDPALVGNVPLGMIARNALVLIELVGRPDKTCYSPFSPACPDRGSIGAGRQLVDLVAAETQLLEDQAGVVAGVNGASAHRGGGCGEGQG